MPNAMDISPPVYRTRTPSFSAKRSSPLDHLLGALTEQIQYAQETGNLRVVSKAHLDAYTQKLMQHVPPQQNPKLATALRFFRAFVDFVYDVIFEKKHLHVRDFDDRTDLVVYFSQMCDLELTRNYKAYADRLIQSCLFPRGDIRSFIQRFKRDLAKDATWERYTRPLFALFEVYHRHGVFQQVKAHIEGVKSKSRYAANAQPKQNIQAEEDEREDELETTIPYYKKQKEMQRRQARQSQKVSSDTTTRLRRGKDFLDSVHHMRTQKRQQSQHAPPPSPPPHPPRANATAGSARRPGPPPPQQKATPRANAAAGSARRSGPPPPQQKATPRANAAAGSARRSGPSPRGPSPRTHAKAPMRNASPSSFDEKAFEAVQRPLIRQEIENMIRQKSLKRVKREILLKYHPDKNPGAEARAKVQFHIANEILQEKGAA